MQEHIRALSAALKQEGVSTFQHKHSPGFLWIDRGGTEDVALLFAGAHWPTIVVLLRAKKLRQKRDKTAPHTIHVPLVVVRVPSERQPWLLGLHTHTDAHRGEDAERARIEASAALEALRFRVSEVKKRRDRSGQVMIAQSGWLTESAEIGAVAKVLSRLPRRLGLAPPPSEGVPARPSSRLHAMDQDPSHHLLGPVADLEAALAAHGVACTTTVSTRNGSVALECSSPEDHVFFLLPHFGGGWKISMSIEIFHPFEKRIKHPARKLHHKQIAPRLTAAGMVRTDFEYGHSPEKSHDYALGSWEGVGTSSEDTARKIALLTTIPAYIDKVDG